MDGRQFSGWQDSRFAMIGSQEEEAPHSDATNESGFSSTTANMDKFDYLNMLAEARIVDIVWVQ